MIKTAALIGLGLCIIVLSGCAPKIDPSSRKVSSSTNLKDEREITRLNAEIKLMKSKLAQVNNPEIKRGPVPEKGFMTKKGPVAKRVSKPVSKPVSMSDSKIPVAGWEMPEEFKVVKRPDAAPSIFGGTLAGSKAEISRNYDKLSNMDDKNFVDSYQLLRENIQSAFNSNESKFSESEKGDFELKMQTLKNRYYEILYRD